MALTLTFSTSKKWLTKNLLNSDYITKKTFQEYNKTWNAFVIPTAISILNKTKNTCK